MKEKLSAYIRDLTITNRVLFVAAALAAGLQIVSMFGYLGNEQPWTLRIVSFSLLALVAILLESQVHQVRLDKDRDTKMSSLIESEGANSRALVEVSQKLDVLTKGRRRITSSLLLSRANSTHCSLQRQPVYGSSEVVQAVGNVVAYCRLLPELKPGMSCTKC